MNSHLRNLGLVALAATFPLAAMAQSSSSSTGSSTTRPSSSSSATSPSSSGSTSGSTYDSTRPGTTGSTHSGTMGAAGTSSGSTMASTSDTLGTSGGIANIQRVSNDMVDRQFTAKALIGKDVYDNRDKKIGEVKDVVLDSSRVQQLASAITSKSANRFSTGSTAGSTSGAATTRSTTATGSTSSTGTTGSMSSIGDTASSMANSALSSLGLGNEPAAIISFGGFMGVGNNLLRVPLSQLRYDSSREHITLNVTETELSSLKDVSDTTRSATE